VLQEGTGDKHPSEADIVTVNYTGWTTDGRMFDSSVKRGEPAEFPLNRVIKGWTEGVQLMVNGEKRRFWIPGNLAYGEVAANDPHAGMGPPRGTLVFDVELISFKEAPKPPDAPKDVAKIPKNAKKTKSGIGSRVLTKGTGKEHPTATSVVTVHYSGWTTDGKMFDSSIVRGTPATFGLNQVIPGWTEGLQLMVVGETRRIWIPENLAYGGRAGRPAGMLVFDVELLEIKN
jgi:peptidylprolyl isomerase